MDGVDSGKKEKRNKPTVVEWGLGGFVVILVMIVMEHSTE
jgi:hypothetical protein